MSNKDILEIVYWGISLLILGLNVYFIATSAVNAVRVGRELNTSQQKDNAKRNLFLTLFALRGSPVHYDFVRGLNQIDIVFEDCPKVLKAWHDYYDSLQIKEQANAQKNWELLRVTLLSEMAMSLGYSRISQTDMLKNYSPEGHSNQAFDDWEFRDAAKQYFQKGSLLYDVLIDNAKKQQDKEQGAQQ